MSYLTTETFNNNDQVSKVFGQNFSWQNPTYPFQSWI